MSCSSAWRARRPWCGPTARSRGPRARTGHCCIHRSSPASSAATRSSSRRSTRRRNGRQQDAPGNGRIAGQRRIVGRAAIARRRHRSLQRRARSGGTESNSAVGRARHRWPDRRGRERMVRELRTENVEEREPAVEVIHLRPARSGRLRTIEARGAIVLKSRNSEVAVRRMRSDPLCLRHVEIRVYGEPNEAAGIEAIEPAVVAEEKAVRACGSNAIAC